MQGIRGAGVERGAGIVWSVGKHEMPGLRGAGDAGRVARGSGTRGEWVQAAVRVAEHAVREGVQLQGCCCRS